MLALCAWTSARALSQQVNAELALEQTQFLAGEDIEVAVQITNFSGRELTLGTEKDWLRFAILDGDQAPVRVRHEPSVAGEFTVPSSKVATRRVNLAPAFELTAAGRYRLMAMVKIPQLQKELTPSARTFDIVKGTVLWQQEVGLPPAPGQDPGTTDARKYTLLHSSTTRGLKLYLRITDPTDAVFYRVFPLSTMVTFSRPEAQVDQESRLHVLNQYGAKGFIYCVVNPRGELVVRERYDYSNTRPRLRLDADGKIVVGGGTHQPGAFDLPGAPEVAGSSAPAKKAE
jgi:hypothetical protein